MRYYIANGTFYQVPSSTAQDELYHYGVPGMKWGKRKQYQPVGGVRQRMSNAYQNMNNARVARQQTRQQNRQARQEARNTPEAQAKRAETVAKAKKAAKIGAAVAGTALAAYGTYKLAKFVQQKRSAAAMSKAQDFIDQNILRKVGETTFTDGTRSMDFSTLSGNHKMTTIAGARNVIGKDAGRYNAGVVAKGRQMYKDATNTRLDKGLAKVVNAGDAVGKAAKNAGTAVKNTAKNAGTAVKNTAKNAGTTVKNTANKAKNRVLDVVNPIYEYTPTTTSRTTTSSINDLGRKGTRTYTETVTNYVKTRKRRT